MDFRDKDLLARVRKAVEAAREQTDADRRAYERRVKKYAGVWTEPNKRKSKNLRIINMLRQSASVLVTQLSGGIPRFHVSHNGQARKRWYSRVLQANLNQLVEDVHFEETLATCVLSAYFKMGIAKIQTAEGSRMLFGDDTWVVEGRPSITAVSYCDYFQDMSAIRPGRFMFQGDYFDVSWDKLKEDGLYDRQVVAKMAPAQKGDYAYEGQDVSSAREAYGYTPTRDRTVKDMVRCVDIYFPEERTLVTWPYRIDTPPLRVLKVDDPDGPYRTLGFDDIPDNTLPASPVENEENLDDLHNSAWRKMAMLTEQMRTFFVYEDGAEADAKAQQRAEHGQYVKVRDMESTEVRSIGGVGQNEAATAQLIQAQFDRAADNLPLRAGTGPQADTATEAGIMQQNNGTITSRRRHRVARFSSSCGKALLRRLWDDRSNRTAYYQGDGVSIPLRADMGNERIGDFDDYRCDVVEYSLFYESPEQKANRLLATLRDLNDTGLLPVFQQAGLVPDGQEILETLAEYRNQSELLRWFTSGEPPIDAAEQETRMPASTTRTQIRRSVGRAVDPMQLAIQGMTPANTGAA
jgi:hypothetical protein